jgi:hypothetical protein
LPVGAVQLVQIALNALLGEGAVQFSLNVDGETRAGTLIGYLADPLGSHATLRLSEELTAQASEEFRRISLADFLRYCVPGWQT